MKSIRRMICLFLIAVSVLSILNHTRVESAGKKLAALTFDDGPCSDTLRLLDELKKRGVHCTFFMLGPNAKRYPEIVRRCYEDGHQIASHTYDHSQLTTLTDAQIKKQVSDTAAILDQAIGAKNSYIVRPPYGSYNQRVLNALGVPAIYWSVDSNDWRWTNDADKTCSEILKYTSDGDIILVHDIHTWSVTGALRAVDKLLAQGYEFVTVSELFRRRGAALNAGNIYFSKRSSGADLPAISTPKISLSASNDALYITITADSGTKIYYTTDGSIPNAASRVYTAPIPLKSGSVKITAVAGYDMNGSRSAVSSAELRYQKYAEPKLEIDESGLVTVTGAPQIRCTTDGRTPTAADILYTAPFRVSPGTVVQARSIASDGSAIPSGTVTLCYSGEGQVYADVKPKDWFYSGIEYAASQGILRGVGGYRMDPGGTVTRAMLVTVLHRMCGSPDVEGSAQFTDVPAGKWYTKAVLWARENRVVEGYADGSFRPEQPISRQQLAVILYRFHRSYKGLRADTQGNLDAYTDNNKVSAYAKQALVWATGRGVISGLPGGLLDPTGAATRAQLAVLLQRYQSATAGESRYYLTDSELLSKANNLLPIISSKNYYELAEIIDVEYGLTVTAFSTVDVTDKKIRPSDLASSKFGSRVDLWGYWDGSGEPIEMTADEYWNRFVWNANYENADSIGINRIIRSGNAAENLEQAYPDCLFVDYFIDSSMGYQDGTDWSSLKLVFKNVDGEWCLVALVHGEWTV